MVVLRSIARGLAGIAIVATIGTISLGVCAGTVSAHTLDNSTVRLVLGDGGVTGTISLAVTSLDKAFDNGGQSTDLSPGEYADRVVAYVDEHFSIQGRDGLPWPINLGNVQRQSTEGIETVTIDVVAPSGGADPSDIAVTFDAIIDAVPGHEAVLVLETVDGVVSTPGVFSADNRTVAVGKGSTSVAVGDMVVMGFRHVLDGADHLLFLLTLLLPAPFVVAAGRWTRGPGLVSSLRKVFHVVTAFTIGHSVTLLASTLGWIRPPTRPVEVVIAASVAVAAIHAIRPIVRGGEPVIAGVFGLVHGMAFAGFLSDLGLSGRVSGLALLGFNVGIECAQLVVAAGAYVSLFVLLAGRWGDRIRVFAASISLGVALMWIVSRSAGFDSPLGSAEVALAAHLWVAALCLAAVALAVLVVRNFGGSTGSAVGEVSDASTGLDAAFPSRLE